MRRQGLCRTAAGCSCNVPHLEQAGRSFPARRYLRPMKQMRFQVSDKMFREKETDGKKTKGIPYPKVFLLYGHCIWFRVYVLMLLCTVLM